MKINTFMLQVDRFVLPDGHCVMMLSGSMRAVLDILPGRKRWSQHLQRRTSAQTAKRWTAKQPFGDGWPEHMFCRTYVEATKELGSDGKSLAR